MTEIDKEAWCRCHSSYIANALQPDSLENWSGNLTVHDLAAAAAAWADDYWTDHTETSA